MKIKIKNFNGELPSYLTVGKVYPADTIDDYYGGCIIGDDCEKVFIQINECAHLNGGSWEVVNEKHED